ncbi:MAG: hypothetical protein HOI17_03970 [Alphaproteobacteria bacterium]|nr:hypothetical protein [Alphaproteobacteria bacterium]
MKLTALFISALRAIAAIELSKVLAIGLSSQMPGLVLLDDFDEGVTPVILWNDARYDAQASSLAGKQP